MNLRELRKKANETQFDVSVATRIQVSYISRLETGAIKNPRYETLKKLAEHFKVNVEDLMIASGKK